MFSSGLRNKTFLPLCRTQWKYLENIVSPSYSAQSPHLIISKQLPCSSSRFLSQLWHFLQLIKSPSVSDCDLWGTTQISLVDPDIVAKELVCRSKWKIIKRCLPSIHWKLIPAPLLVTYPDLQGLFMCDPFWPLFQNIFPNNVRTKIVHAKSDSLCRILLCQDLRSFWGALVCSGINF